MCVYLWIFWCIVAYVVFTQTWVPVSNSFVTLLVHSKRLLLISFQQIASILILQIPETKLFCPLLQCLHENTCVYLFISFDIYMRISKKNMFFFQILFIIFIHIVFCDTATCVYLENIHIYWLCLIHMQRKYGMTNHTKSMGMPLKHFRL